VIFPRQIVTNRRSSIRVIISNLLCVDRTYCPSIFSIDQLVQQQIPPIERQVIDLLPIHNTIPEEVRSDGEVLC
jgi:hypothetical protein